MNLWLLSVSLSLATPVLTKHLWVNQGNLPKYKYKCDPSNPSSKCKGKFEHLGFGSYGLGYEKPKKSNNVFCKMYGLCFNYSFGNLYLTAYAFWRSKGYYGQRQEAVHTTEMLTLLVGILLMTHPSDASGPLSINTGDIGSSSALAANRYTIPPIKYEQATDFGGLESSALISTTNYKQAAEVRPNSGAMPTTNYKQTSGVLKIPGVGAVPITHYKQSGDSEYTVGSGLKTKNFNYKHALGHQATSYNPEPNDETYPSSLRTQLLAKYANEQNSGVQQSFADSLASSVKLQMLAALISRRSPNMMHSIQYPTPGQSNGYGSQQTNQGYGTARVSQGYGNQETPQETGVSESAQGQTYGSAGVPPMYANQQATQEYGAQQLPYSPTVAGNYDGHSEQQPPNNKFLVHVNVPVEIEPVPLQMPIIPMPYFVWPRKRWTSRAHPGVVDVLEKSKINSAGEAVIGEANPIPPVPMKEVRKEVERQRKGLSSRYISPAKASSTRKKDSAEMGDTDNERRRKSTEDEESTENERRGESAEKHGAKLDKKRGASKVRQPDSEEDADRSQRDSAEDTETEEKTEKKRSLNEERSDDESDETREDSDRKRSQKRRESTETEERSEEKMSRETTDGETQTNKDSREETNEESSGEEPEFL